MQAGQYLFQTMGKPASDRFDAKNQPFRKQLNKPLDPGFAIEADHIQVHAACALKIRCGKQMQHQRFAVHTVGSERNDNPNRVLVIRFIPDIRHHGQFFSFHLGSNLLDYLCRRHLVRHFRYNDVPVFRIPKGTQPDGAMSGPVDLHNIFS